MASILIAECIHEICSFNPVPTRYDDFSIQRGQALFEYHRHLGSEVGGALGVFEAEPSLEVRPTFGARGITSGGTIAGADFERLAGEFLGADPPGRAGRWRLLRPARRDGLHPGRGPRGLFPAGSTQDPRRAHPHRRLVRPARHPHRPHAPARRRDRRLPHLPARRLLRDRPAGGPAAAAHAAQGDPAGHGARRHPRPGARRRADHRHRGLRADRRPGAGRSSRARAASRPACSSATPSPTCRTSAATASSSSTATPSAPSARRCAWPGSSGSSATGCRPGSPAWRRACGWPEPRAGTVVLMDAADATSSGASGDSNAILAS